MQAAEKAAAQSNREISGYRIESISLTHERQEHYLRKHVGLTNPSGPLAGLQPGGSAGIGDSFPVYPSAEQLGSISGFPSQLVSPSPPNVLLAALLERSPWSPAHRVNKTACVHQGAGAQQSCGRTDSLATCIQGGVGQVMPYDQQVMLSRLQGTVPPDQILETMYGGSINQAALLQARHGMYAQQVRTVALVYSISAVRLIYSISAVRCPGGAFIVSQGCLA